MVLTNELLELSFWYIVLNFVMNVHTNSVWSIRYVLPIKFDNVEVWNQKLQCSNATFLLGVK
jgi:hypothetical protein